MLACNGVLEGRGREGFGTKDETFRMGKLSVPRLPTGVNVKSCFVARSHGHPCACQSPPRLRTTTSLVRPRPLLFQCPRRRRLGGTICRNIWGYSGPMTLCWFETAADRRKAISLGPGLSAPGLSRLPLPTCTLSSCHLPPFALSQALSLKPSLQLASHLGLLSFPPRPRDPSAATHTPCLDSLCTPPPQPWSALPSLRSPPRFPYPLPSSRKSTAS